MRCFSAALLALSLSGCATIFSGTTQDVAIRTTPGAKYSVTNAGGDEVASGEVGEDALAKMNLVRRAGYFSPQAYRVNLTKAGHRPRNVSVEPGMNPWYFMNILIGGFVGMVIVDPLTGAMYRMVPTTEDAPLTPTGENVAELQAVAAYQKLSRNYPVSRYDYEALQVVKPLQCEPMGNPAVFAAAAGVERLTYACRDGRQVMVACRSSAGCVVE